MGRALGSLSGATPPTHMRFRADPSSLTLPRCVLTFLHLSTCFPPSPRCVLSFLHLSTCSPPSHRRQKQNSQHPPHMCPGSGAERWWEWTARGREDGECGGKMAHGCLCWSVQIRQDLSLGDVGVSDLAVNEPYRTEKARAVQDISLVQGERYAGLLHSRKRKQRSLHGRGAGSTVHPPHLQPQLLLQERTPSQPASRQTKPPVHHVSSLAAQGLHHPAQRERRPQEEGLERR